MIMGNHSFDVQWRFVVPPENTQRLVITQRQDGPFRTDKVGERGHYYVSREELQRGEWVHVRGSSSGAYNSYAEAHAIAAGEWTQLRTVVAGGENDG